MKIRKSLKYLFYTILIFLLILFRDHIEQLNRLYFDREFNLNNFYLIINLLISIGLGVFLGLNHTMKEVRKNGKWQVDFSKLIIIGIPLLFISLYHIWIYGNIQILKDIFAYGLGSFRIFGLSTSSVSLFQVTLGYIVVTSFYKNTNKT